MTSKQRLSASIDSDLLRAAHAAVEDGRVDSVSAWVNDALRSKAEHERRMHALDAFLDDYEAHHGTITEAEIDDAVREARGRATVARSPGRRRASSRRGIA